jgi:eukaryotic-like serine/threonine-protein kinase
MQPERIQQYQIIRRLGAGAYGTVYYATDTVLTRPVVIKLLDRGTESGERLRSRTLAEARLASAIEHLNVCTVYQVGEWEGRPFIAMQYVAGRSLQELLEAGPLQPRVALSLGIQLADGLAAAHRIGILHRDLKPANVMVAEDGTVKILDFGLARRQPDATAESAGPDGARSGATGSGGVTSEHFGTTAYMAPEQFLLRRSSEQSDVFALGVILYQMATGRHPFLPPGTDPSVIPLAIQTRQPTPPTAIRSDLPPPLEPILLRALAKQPAARFRYAFEVADALKALMRSLYAETGAVPGESSAILPAPTPAARERPGLLAGLVERFRTTREPPPPDDAIAVLPFHHLHHPAESTGHGVALSNAVAMRLSRVPCVSIRPLSTYLAVADRWRDPAEVGRELRAGRVLLGSYAPDGEGTTVHWQLLSVASMDVRAAGTITIDSPEIAVVQNRVAEQLHSELIRAGELGSGTGAAAVASRLDDLPAEVREEYLEARALLAGFASRSTHRDDLERARQRYEAVLEQAPAFAPAHAGLGTVYLRFARNGFGGTGHLRAAERCFTRALELDPELREAKLYRASTLLWAGEKESARLDIQFLLHAAPDDADVHLAAGVLLQLDGLLQEALRAQTVALRLDPAVATRVYHYRSRMHLMLGRRDLARRELERGLAIEPGHSLLRNTLGYWHFYEGNLAAAIETVEAIVAGDPSLRIAVPTLAMCYARAGREAEAAALITPETLEAAAADAEIAYRLATFHAVAGEAGEALRWLRTAIYRGNENHPWFASNPAWAPLHADPEFARILEELEEVHRLNRPRWAAVLAALPE